MWNSRRRFGRAAAMSSSNRSSGLLCGVCVLPRMNVAPYVEVVSLSYLLFTNHQESTNAYVFSLAKSTPFKPGDVIVVIYLKNVPPF